MQPRLFNIVPFLIACFLSTGNAQIDPLTVRSLLIVTASNDTGIATATGFVVEQNGINYLITNWHVVSGRDPSTNLVVDGSGRTPNNIQIWHHSKQLGTFNRRIEPLYRAKDQPRWREHPQGRRYDVVALPLSNVDSLVQLYPLNLALADTDVLPEIGMPVSIIGFPVGLVSPANFAIWKTGHIASEPRIDFEGLPSFLIDATTRGGMSGSPVILRLSGGFKTKSGNSIMSQSGYSTLFLGIYSAQQQFAEIGFVWKPIVIKEILNTF